MVPRRLAIPLSTLICACAGKPAMVSAPRLDGSGSIVAEHVALSCVGDKADLRCTVRGRYELTPDPTPSSVRVLSERANLSAPELSPRASPGPVSRLADPGLADHGVRGQVAVQTGELEAGADHLVIEGELRPEPRDSNWLIVPAPLARHPQLSRQLGYHACLFDARGCFFELDYLPARPRDRGPGYRNELSIDAPADWQIEQDVRSTRHVTRLHTGRSKFAPGGPVIGAGGRYVEGRWLPAARVGWELFAPDWLAHSVALEVDGEARVVTAFVSELVTRRLLILPSVGAGVGVPFEVHPRPSAGVRGQVSAQLPYLGVVANVDVFPGPVRTVVTTIYVQLSL
jgi:hypothetical protein